MYPLIGIDQFKEYINETGTTQDVFIQHLVNRATIDIENFLKFKVRARAYTEYYNGDGTKRLFLNNYPVIGTTADVDLYDDVDRGFSSTYKFADTDWVLTNENGLCELLSDSSLGAAFQKSTKNVKAIYTAGYDNYEVITGYNDAIDFNEGSTQLNATLTAGTYTATTLCTEIDTRLTAAGAGSYTVTFNNVTCMFTITKSTGTFQILWNNGTRAATNAADLLGYSTSANDTAVLTYTSDYARPGIPEDLQEACIFLCYDRYQKSPKSSVSKFGERSIASSAEGGGTLSYLTDAIPVEVINILEAYRRIRV